MHFDYLTPLFRKTHALVLALVFLVSFIKLPHEALQANHETDQSNDPFVFVHGFYGWGENDTGYDTIPYWGASTGNLMETFRDAGYTCVAPSVDPVGSVWDRACELYAQLVGARVDYGAAHSAQCGHDRYGKDYTGRAMISSWDVEHKINLIGHSLGAPTCTMLASLMKNGDAAEREAGGSDLSPLFAGGHDGWIRSVTGIAGVFSGTTLPINAQALNDTGLYLDQKLIDEPFWFLPGLQRSLQKKMLDGIFDVFERIASGEVAAPDTGIYDMQPDNMAKLNETIETIDNVYYLAVPCDTTTRDEADTHWVPDMTVTDPPFMAFVPVIGRTNTVTPGGMVLDESWQPNDGVVNTISETGPIGAQKNTLNAVPADTSPALLQKGIYNVFPIYRGSHLALTGNMIRLNRDCGSYLLSLMELINALD